MVAGQDHPGERVFEKSGVEQHQENREKKKLFAENRALVESVQRGAN